MNFQKNKQEDKYANINESNDLDKHRSREINKNRKEERNSHADRNYTNTSSSGNKLLKKSHHSKRQRSRSRSRSRDKKRHSYTSGKHHHETSRRYKDHNSTKRKRSCSSSSSSSNSSCPSVSSRSSYSPQYFKKINDEKKPQSLRKPGAGIKIFGRSLLSNIIQENVSKNKHMDTEEVKRATDNLQRVSHEDNLQATLMSSYINTLLTSEKDGYYGHTTEIENKNEENLRQYLCVIENCGSSFKDPVELKEHLNNH